MKKKTIIEIIIGLIIILLVALFIASLTMPKLSFSKDIDGIIRMLNTKNKESLYFEAKIKATGGEMYEVLDNSFIKGSYMSDDTFKMQLDYTSNYKETVNISLFSDSNNTYYLDPFYNDKSIKFDSKNVDFSINNLKLNIKKMLQILKNTNMPINTIIQDGNSVTTFRLNDISIFDSVELDYPYNELFNVALDYIKDSEVSIYAKPVTGSFVKLEIKNDKLIVIEKNNDGYYIEVINKDNVVYKLNIGESIINYSKLKGSNKIFDIEIDYTLEKEPKNLKDVDTNNYILYSELDKYSLKEDINKSKTKKEIVNLYYFITGKSNVVDMYVKNNNYEVYYNTPDGYLNNYSGKSIKKYIKVDKRINYSIKEYNQNEMAEYVFNIYNNEISKNYYKKVTKSALESLEYNNRVFYYEYVTRLIDTGYRDYDDTKTVLYVWTNLDDKNAYLIEYDFDGTELSEEEITKLLDMETKN